MRGEPLSRCSWLFSSTKRMQSGPEAANDANQTGAIREVKEF
jgi:hypothetical protein